MIIDETGIILTPGNKGVNCLGNGKHYNKEGELIEICCDECDYLKCCAEEIIDCENCNDVECPNCEKKKTAT